MQGTEHERRGARAGRITMQPLARATIEKLNRITNGALMRHPDRLDFIAEIERGVADYLCGGARCMNLLADMPLAVGNALLYPLSIAHREWVLDVGLPSFPNDTPHDTMMRDLTVAFAMAARNDRLFEKLPTPASTRLAVKDWARKLTCTFDALMETVLLLSPGRSEPDEYCEACGGVVQPPVENLVDRRHIGPLIAALTITTGLAPMTILFDMGDGVRQHIMRSLAKRSADAGGGVPDFSGWARFVALKNAIIAEVNDWAAGHPA